MIRIPLCVALLSLMVVGCNDRDDIRTPPPSRPNPPPATPNATPNNNSNRPGVNVDTPGVDVDVNRKDGKVKVDVDVDRK
jgi:hypothetical protein